MIYVAKIIIWYQPYCMYNFLYLLVNETGFFLMNQGCFSFSREHFFNSDQPFQRKKIFEELSLAAIGHALWGRVF